MERLEEPKSSALWWNWRRMSSKGKCSAVCEGCDGADGGGDGDDRRDDADSTEPTKKVMATTGDLTEATVRTTI